MNTLPSKTLSQIVTEQYETASIFEKYQLDYCCRGKRSLEEACIEKHIPLEEVLTDLQKVMPGKNNKIDFDKITLSGLVDYIVGNHHTYVKQEIPRILSYLEKVTTKHGNYHNELYKIAELFVELSNEMNPHLEAEETILFPRIKQLEKNRCEPFSYEINSFEYLQLPIIDMVDGHEDVGNIMAEIRKLTDNYTPPENSCTTYKILFSSLSAFEVDLHHHVHLENSILFPKALALEKEIKKELQN